MELKNTMLIKSFQNISLNLQIFLSHNEITFVAYKFFELQNITVLTLSNIYIYIIF